MVDGGRLPVVEEQVVALPEAPVGRDPPVVAVVDPLRRVRDAVAVPEAGGEHLGVLLGLGVGSLGSGHVVLRDAHAQAGLGEPVDAARQVLAVDPVGVQVVDVRLETDAVDVAALRVDRQRQREQGVLPGTGDVGSVLVDVLRDAGSAACTARDTTAG